MISLVQSQRLEEWTVLAEKTREIGAIGSKPARELTGRQRSSLVTGNVRVAGRRTSVRLEPEMWSALNEVCAREGMSLSALVTRIERGGHASTLTAAIRVHLLLYFMSAATEEGHRAAGHGVLQRQPKTLADA